MYQQGNGYRLPLTSGILVCEIFKSWNL